LRCSIQLGITPARSVPHFVRRLRRPKKAPERHQAMGSTFGFAQLLDQGADSDWYPLLGPEPPLRSCVAK
jgi:hypothetical protein